MVGQRWGSELAATSIGGVRPRPPTLLNALAPVVVLILLLLFRGGMASMLMTVWLIIVFGFLGLRVEHLRPVEHPSVEQRPASQEKNRGRCAAR